MKKINHIANKKFVIYAERNSVPFSNKEFRILYHSEFSTIQNSVIKSAIKSEIIANTQENIGVLLIIFVT